MDQLGSALSPDALRRRTARGRAGVPAERAHVPVPVRPELRLPPVRRRRLAGRRRLRRPAANDSRDPFPEAAGEAPEDPSDPSSPGGGWTQARRDTLGAAPLLWLLEAPGGDEAAVDGAEDTVRQWAGGAVTLFTDGDRSALAVAWSPMTTAQCCATSRPGTRRPSTPRARKAVASPCWRAVDRSAPSPAMAATCGSASVPTRRRGGTQPLGVVGIRRPVPVQWRAVELVTMPQLGETVTEGTITRWHKVGDAVAIDDVLFEVSTEKVDTEVPSAVAGVLRAVHVAEGETVPVGTPLPSSRPPPTSRSTARRPRRQPRRRLQEQRRRRPRRPTQPLHRRQRRSRAPPRPDAYARPWPRRLPRRSCELCSTSRDSRRTSRGRAR